MRSGTVESPRTARLAGGDVPYTLRRTPRARGLRLTVDDRRGVMVSIPPEGRPGWRHPDATVERFLDEREPWIRRHLARQQQARLDLAARGGIADRASFRYRGEIHTLRVQPAADERSSIERRGDHAGDELMIALSTSDRGRVGELLADWLKERAGAAIDREVEVHGRALGVAPDRIAIRDPRSRWGSASRPGRLMFSWRLILAPPEALETVVIHELAHLREFGHGARFWALVASRRPDHAAWRRWLRRHTYELHHALDDATGAR